MKEIKGEPTQNCATCQYRKRKGSGSFKGVLIRDPDFMGKCCRPEGLCERRRMIPGTNPGCDRCGINDSIIKKDGENLCKECSEEEPEEENGMILDALEPKTKAKKRRDPDHEQMNLF